MRERTEQGGVVYQDNHLAYDALGRLRDIDDGHVHIAIDYDAMGNRTHIQSHVMDSADQRDDKQSWYAYDAMNRQILADGAYNGNADDMGNITGSQGHRVTYDFNGNRISDTTWGTVVNAANNTASAGLVQTDYQYDALGRLTVTSENGLTLDQRDYDTGSRVLQSGNDGSLSLDYLKARYGGEGKAGNGAQTIYMSYDEAGRLNFEEVWNRDGTLAYDVRYNAYDPVGNVDQYTVVTDRGTSTETTNIYAPSTVRMEGYKQTGDHLISWTTERQDGESQTLLDVQGNTIGVRDVIQNSYNRDIVNDATGQALYVNANGQVQRQLIVNGQVLGRYGQEITGTHDDGTARFGEVTDFNFSYQSIDATTASSGSRYTVAAGDTLQGIAQTLYGDSQLWYVIADANGLQSGQPLRIGQVLDIPAKVGTVHNNALTYKPYDPSKITGDTAPHLPTPAGGGGNGCGVVGQVIVMVVIIVVCYFTEQWYLMDYGVAEGGATAAGAATYTTSSMVAAGAVGGAAGATAGQLAAMALGMQQNFDWKGVALGAIGGAIGGAFTNTSFVSGSNLANAAMRAAISNALTQGVGVVTGLQRRFDWTSVAASALGSAAAEGLTEAMLGDPTIGPNGRITGYQPVAGAFSSTFAKAFGASATDAARIVSGLGAAAVSTVVRGGKVDIASLAADAFGNMLIAGLSGKQANGGQQQETLDKEKQQGQDQAGGGQAGKSTDNAVIGSAPSVATSSNNIQAQTAAFIQQHPEYASNPEMVAQFYAEQAKSQASASINDTRNDIVAEGPDWTQWSAGGTSYSVPAPPPITVRPLTDLEGTNAQASAYEPSFWGTTGNWLGAYQENKVGLGDAVKGIWANWNQDYQIAYRTSNAMGGAGNVAGAVVLGGLATATSETGVGTVLFSAGAVIQADAAAAKFRSAWNGQWEGPRETTILEDVAGRNVAQAGEFLSGIAALGALPAGADSAVTYPDGLAYRADLPDHLAGPDGFTKSGQLSGTHNLDNATSSLDSVGANYNVNPTSNLGISELSYDYVNANGKTITGNKTVYDPSIYSDQTILDLSQQAGQNSFENYLLNPAQTRFDINQGGINFRSYINFDPTTGAPYVGNVHPIK